jgi:hypothetical protein
VIGAETAIVGTTVLYWSVIVIRHLRWLDEYFAAATIVIHIIGHQHPLEAMLRASFEHKDLAILKDDLGVDAAVTGGAD